MPNGPIGSEGTRALQWIEDGPAVFETLRRMLQEYESAKGVAQAAVGDRDRLQQQCVALREEVRQLQAESKRLQKERAEVVQWILTTLHEAATRFPLTPPSR